MAKLSELQILRKRLGIKKLKSKIPITEFERAAVKGLRIKEMQELVARARIKQRA